METFEKTLEILANFAELAAGLIIIFSVIKVWPTFTNLAEAAKRKEDFSEDYASINEGLSTVSQCQEINSPEEAVEEILLAAIKDAASDIHIDLQNTGRIRIRRNGVLRVLATYSPDFHDTLVGAFKRRATIQQGGQTGVANGRLQMTFGRQGEKVIDFRVLFAPANAGEVITLRILDPSSAKLGFEALGIPEKMLEDLKQRLHQTRGLLVFSGPTGSGKTVVLYTGLNALNDESFRIVTIEDPMEIELGGITQLPVADAPGHRMHDLYSAALRMDPDLVMIGEIRDEQTAGMCLRAQEAHLVLTTIYSESAVDAVEKIYRLSPDIDFNNFYIMNQRLTRRLCPECAVPLVLTDQDRDYIERICRVNHEDADLLGSKYLAAVGCDACELGFRGRNGGYEALTVTPRIVDLVKHQAPTASIWEQAVLEGARTLQFDLLQKASRGITSLDEIRRVSDLAHYEPLH